MHPYILAKTIAYIRTKQPIQFVILFFIIGLLYFQTRKFSFLIGWDDQWFVTNHYTEGGFSMDNVFSVFSEFYYGQYAPVNQLYYTAIYQSFGYSPAMYHLFNVLIHTFNCVLVYYLVIVLLNDNAPLQTVRNVRIAFLTALLFAILPINVEPVSWIAASKVLLYAFFYLFALLAYRKYLYSGKGVWFYLCMLLGLLSFGAKEQAVVLPICLLLIDYLYGRNFYTSQVWLEKLPFVIMSLILGLATIDSQQLDDGGFYSVWERIPLFFYTLTEFFTKCILPVNVSYLYPFPFQSGGAIPSWMWIPVICLPLFLILVWPVFKNKMLLFPACFFLIHILLTCNLFSLARFAVTADRYAYVASIGACLLCATLLVKTISDGRKPLLFLLITGTYITFLFLTSYHYVPVWQNVTTLKKRLADTVESRRDYKSLCNEK
ncbi:hypothetical protein SAMN04488511_102275 [Pedobacter suwonensis]|uniref:Dolichyl-phosphate-mannose-protein mannosyltransferase n=1 Tax=Pedobacter suwonensis TaxID=332999 RepID=A0A1I0SP20_9SPHI|nr:hypothetical protein [Pedobacter suwonensis]SFA41229.1 hypothetical protein SAMN04488511_102275 [Pedobacter suwonensis]